MVGMTRVLFALIIWMSLLIVNWILPLATGFTEWEWVSIEIMACQSGLFMLLNALLLINTDMQYSFMQHTRVIGIRLVNLIGFALIPVYIMLSIQIIFGDLELFRYSPFLLITGGILLSWASVEFFARRRSFTA